MKYFCRVAFNTYLSRDAKDDHHGGYDNNHDSCRWQYCNGTDVLIKMTALLLMTNSTSDIVDGQITWTQLWAQSTPSEYKQAPHCKAFLTKITKIAINVLNNFNADKYTKMYKSIKDIHHTLPKKEFPRKTRGRCRWKPFHTQGSSKSPWRSWWQ